MQSCRRDRLAILSACPALLTCLLVAGASSPALARAGTSTGPAAACQIETAAGGSLASAKLAFAARCEGIVRRDCDPLPAGGWGCSSEVIGRDAPGGVVAAANSAADLAPVAEPDGVCLSPVSASLEAAKSVFRSSCAGFVRRDCDPVDYGWRCSSGVIGDSAPGVAGDMPQMPPEPTPDTPTGPTAPQQPDDVEVPPPTPPVSGGTIGRVAANDLVALHYDNCPDKDDGHALAAGYSVVQTVGLQRVLVVNGTCGQGIEIVFNPASRAVVNAVWGDSALDAIADPAGSVASAADAWAATLANGASVWVAEGGPADFTARVLRLIEQRNPSLQLKRVHVVQHSAGGSFNEQKTIDIAYVKQTADYIAIGDGNGSNNGTANLRQQSSAFVARALASRFATAWRAAFDYLKPDCVPRTEQCKLDFSDTVELLYLIGDTMTTGVDDFADRYID